MLLYFIVRKLKFTREKWRNGEFDVGRNDVKRGINIYIYIYIEREREGGGGLLCVSITHNVNCILC